MFRNSTMLLAPVLLAAFGLLWGCGKSAVLTPGQFTQEFVRALRKASPEIKVAVTKDLELKLTSADGRESTSFLNNAYDLYRTSPQDKTEIIQKYVASMVETCAATHDQVDKSRIIPVIKDRAWIAETRQAMIARGAKETPEHVCEDLNSELVILYAEDSPTNIRYLAPKDLEEAKIDKKDLRPLACENLRKLLPKIERHGEDGLYMLTAGGNYEASLLLLDSIWSGKEMEVTGEIVVAVPARDILVVTGSNDKEGLAKAKAVIEKVYPEGAYRLTKKLFVYRKGKFEVFEP